MFFSRIVSKAALSAVLAFAPIVAAGSAHAQAAVEVQLTYKDKKFDPAEIEEQFDLGYHLKHVDTIFRRVFGES